VELSGDFREHINITEGADGLYRQIPATAPWLSNAVERLTHEHAQITDAVDDLAARLSGPDIEDDLDGVRDLGTTLLGGLVRTGSDLLYEAYESDIEGET
jgi:hypothetical protein